MTRRMKAVDDDEDFSFFDLDINALDREWLMQPKLYFRFARKAAKAHSDMDELKAALDLVFAELDAQIREDPETYFGKKRATDAAIKQCVLSQEEYIDAQKAYNSARRRKGLLDAAVAAMEHRKKALENLVVLHGREYFGDHMSTEAGAAIGDSVKRRTRQGAIKKRE